MAGLLLLSFDKVYVQGLLYTGCLFSFVWDTRAISSIRIFVLLLMLSVGLLLMLIFVRPIKDVKVAEN